MAALRFLFVAVLQRRWTVADLSMTLYGTGMRRAEVIKLKITDIDTPRMVIHIRDGKPARQHRLALCRTLLSAVEPPTTTAPSTEPSPAIEFWSCPHCGGKMIIVE